MAKKLIEEQKREHERAESRRKAELIAKSQRNHIAGTKHTAQDGTNYVVVPNSSWLRVTKKPHESKAAFEAKLERARTKFPPHSNRTKAVV